MEDSGVEINEIPYESSHFDYDSLQKLEFVKWKTKLNNVLHSTSHCGICLEENNILWDVDETINIAELGPKHESTFQEITAVLCSENGESLFASKFICKHCAEIVVKATIFVHNAKRFSKILRTCLQCLEGNIMDTLTTVENSNDYERSIICIGLQNTLQAEFNVQLTEQNSTDDIDNNPNESVIRVDYKCPTCDVIFEDFAVWNAHLNFHANETSQRELRRKEKTAEAKLTRAGYTQCDQCKILVANHEHDQHMKLHVQRTWHCTLCNKVFYSSSSFDTHIIVRHNMLSKDNLVTCKLCLKTYFSKESLNQHKCKYGCTECKEVPCAHEKFLVSYRDQKEAGNRMVQCVECSFTCAKKISLLSHANLDHLDCFNHFCDACSQSFHTKQALTQHKLKYHSISCEYCDTPCKGTVMLHKHQILCQVMERAFKCSLCVASFDTEQDLLVHNQKHTSITCSICSGEFANEAVLNEHLIEDHQKKIPCSMCREDFYSQEDYSAHVTSHPPGTKHLCRVCNLTFNSRFNHRKHLSVHIAKAEKKACPICGKLVGTAHLKYHMESHTKKKTIRRRIKHMKQNCKCEQCGKWFSSDKVLRRHREKHKEEIQCSVCRQFVKPSCLDTHLQTHLLHKTGCGIKKIKCQHCDYGTNYPLCMDAHTNRVHKKVRPYACEKCSKSFYGKITLNEHMKSHGDTKTTGRQCHHCGDYFCNSFSLKTHMRLHTGEKPYKCDECDDRFISASRRKEHKLKRHSVASIPCPICNNVYFTVRDVRAHIKKTHCNMSKGEIDLNQFEGLCEEHLYIFKDHRFL